MAMDRTLANVRDYVNWWPKYAFLRGPDLEAWQHITWWEGPDPQGYLWLVIDNRAAVAASKAHGPEPVARVLVSNVRARGDRGKVAVSSCGVHAVSAVSKRVVDLCTQRPWKCSSLRRMAYTNANWPEPPRSDTPGSTCTAAGLVLTLLLLLLCPCRWRWPRRCCRQMEHGLRVLMPALECNDEIMVVVDNSGVNITQVSGRAGVWVGSR